MSEYRIGYAGGGARVGELVARQTTPSACNLANGDLYTYPNGTSTIDGTVPLTFTWNTRCPGISSTIDLYLYAPDTLGLIKQWAGIPFSQGSFNVQLMPRWWNSTTEARLQIAIMNSGGMSWATTGPPGPVFKVDYPESAMLTTTTEGGMLKTITNSAAATNGGDAIFQNVSNTQTGGISKGAIAAAVVVPLIVIAAIVAVAVRFWRQREAEKRRRWSQALSSTSNLDWEKGARPGERTGSVFGGGINSVHESARGSMGGRPSLTMSAYAAGQARASMAASSVMGDNFAGAGAGVRPSNMRSVSNDGQMGNGSLTNLANTHRQSRISFAESARPERERPDRRSRMSLGNDLRPHSAVFNLKHGSRSASDLPASNLGPNAGSPNMPQGSQVGQSPSPSKSNKSSRLRAALQGNAIVDDEGASRRGSILSDPRRSAYSVYSSGPTPHHPTFRHDADTTEDLDVAIDTSASASDSKDDLSKHSPSPSHSHSTPGEVHAVPTLTTATSTSTVAYGPDSLLAAYAARQGAASPTTETPAQPMPQPMPMSMAPPPVPASNSKKGLKILTAFSKKGSDEKDREKEKERPSPGSAGAPISNPIVHGHGLQVPGQQQGRGGAGSPAPHAF